MTPTEPRFVKIRAIDVVPYRWAIHCFIEGSSKPIDNLIVGQSWSDTEVKISFMLETHNFLGADPDELLELIPQQSKWEPADVDERHRRFVASRPDLKLLMRKCELERELDSIKAVLDGER